MLEGEGERKTSLLLNLTFILGSVLYLTAQGHYAQIWFKRPRRLCQTVLHVNSLAAGAEVGVLSCHIKFQVNASCQSCGAMQSRQLVSFRWHLKAKVGEHPEQIDSTQQSCSICSQQPFSRKGSAITGFILHPHEEGCNRIHLHPHTWDYTELPATCRGFGAKCFLYSIPSTKHNCV